MKKQKARLLTKSTVGAIVTAIALSSSAMAADYSTPKSFSADKVTEVVEYSEPTTEIPYMVMDLNLLNRAAQLTWTVLPNDRLESTAIYVEAGQCLSISGVGNPSNVAFKYGYTNHNTDWYCMGQDSFHYSFPVETSGYYQIYFRNMSALRSVTVTFVYGISK